MVTIHPPIGGFVAPTGIEPTPFQIMPLAAGLHPATRYTQLQVYARVFFAKVAKGIFIWYVSKIFRKTNISYPLIRA